MNRKLQAISVLASALLVCAVTTEVSAQTTNVTVITPKSYEVTFTKFELQNSADDSWVTVPGTPVTLDLATAGANTIAQTLADQTIPAGTYKAFRVTVSANMNIGASNVVGAATYVTDGVTTATVGGVTVPVLLPALVATYDSTAFTVPAAYAALLVVSQAFPAPVTVAAGGSYGTLKVEIDVANTCSIYQLSDLSATWLEPDPPTVIVTP